MFIIEYGDGYDDIVIGYAETKEIALEFIKFEEERLSDLERYIGDIDDYSISEVTNVVEIMKNKKEE